jgi:hypothetical protein
VSSGKSSRVGPPLSLEGHLGGHQANSSTPVTVNFTKVLDRSSVNHWAFGPDGDPAIGVDLTSYASSIWLSKALFAECPEWTTKAAAIAPGSEDGKATDRQTAIRLALASSQLFTTSFSVEAMVAWTSTTS